MIKVIDLGNRKIEYNLEYKKVKNINLRIKPDGTVHVSADKRVPVKAVEDFVISKSGFILNALQRYKNRPSEPPKQYFAEDEICGVILDLCKRIYPYFEKKGVKYPEIKFRKMVSRWGSCNFIKGVLTFNTALMYAPIECIEYVVAHEFTHFLQPNHSGRFYEELEKLIPEWKICRQRLKEITI